MWAGRFDELKGKVADFLKTVVAPEEKRFFAEIDANRKAGNAWKEVPVIEELTHKARALNLWNLFLSHESGLTQHQYAQLAELMGHYIWAAQVFNCDAPDTGNMETLHLYGTAEQKTTWLKPLLDGKIKSAFAMTEPAVASSDATNIACVARREGDRYVINGVKWYISNAGHPNCKILIVLARTGDKDTPRHRRLSMILVPMDTPGVKLGRPMEVFGRDDAPHGHFELTFTNVTVPTSNILLGEGRGFEIAQGRLGPGRIHHCMRAIGVAERALSMMTERALTRVAFGGPLARLGMTQEAIALSRMEIDQARLLVMHAADRLDKVGSKKAFQEIAMIKVVAPRMCCAVVDRAIQVYGAEGVSQETLLPWLYTAMRTLRIADGPDEVHIVSIAKAEIAKHKRAKL
jgi:alkylation response protein AidB-like acyl-CoA dehydrogenase